MQKMHHMRNLVGARIEELRATWVKKLESIMTDRRTQMHSISTADPRGQIDRAREEAYVATHTSTKGELILSYQNQRSGRQKKRDLPISQGI